MKLMHKPVPGKLKALPKLQPFKRKKRRKKL